MSSFLPELRIRINMIDKKIDVYLFDGSYQAVSVSWIHLDQPVAYQVGTHFGILNYKTNT